MHSKLNLNRGLAALAVLALAALAVPNVSANDVLGTGCPSFIVNALSATPTEPIPSNPVLMAGELTANTPEKGYVAAYAPPQAPLTHYQVSFTAKQVASGTPASAASLTVYLVHPNVGGTPSCESKATLGDGDTYSSLIPTGTENALWAFGVDRDSGETASIFAISVLPQ